MSLRFFRRFRPLSLSLSLLLTVGLGSAAAAGPAAAAPVSAAAPVASPTDTGHYYVFRTRDTGKNATGEQNTRCNKYFGLRSALTITRLNALLFAFDTNADTGRITNQTASLLGPGFICGVPALNNREDVDAYAYSSLPGPGVVEGTGPCTIAPVVVSTLPIILSCNLQVKPNAAKGIAGGLITSNSLVNLLDQRKDAPTGSVWTAHIIGPAQNTGGQPGPVPPGTKPETPGLDFFTTRTRDESAPPSSPDCRAAGFGGTPLAVRSANLGVATPDPVSGQVPDAVGPSVGHLTVCYLYKTRTGYRAIAYATLKTSTGTFRVRARGKCRVVSTPAGPELRAQACALTVNGGPAKGGLITSNGLINAGQPASAGDSAVWTFALFGAPPA